MFKNIKRLAQFILPHRWDVVFILVSGFFLGIVSTFPTVLIGLFTNALEEKDLTQKIGPKGMMWLQKTFGDEVVLNFVSNYSLQGKLAAYGFPIVFLILGVTRYYNYYRSRYFAEVVSNDIRYQILHRVVNLNHRFFFSLQSGSGSLLSRTLNDTILIQQGLAHYMDLLREPFIAVISFAALLWLNPQLTLMCLLVAPFIAYVIQKVSKTIRRLSSESQASLDLIAHSFKENVDGIRVIQSYNLENYVRRRFHQKIVQYNSIRKKVSKRAEIASPINEFLVSIAVCGLCLYVLNLALKGRTDISSFLMFLALAANLEKPIKKIQQAWVGVQQTEVSVERVFEVIDCQEVVPEKPVSEQVPFPQNWQTISIKNVSFDYGNKSVLNNINLQVKRGETVALVGESGGGKSTFVNLLERFFDPVSGSIEIDGIDIRNFSLNRLRHEMAYVSQDTFIFDETIEENIRCGDETKSMDVVREAARNANALSFIEALPNGFLSRAGERGSSLSGGQKQRLSIARALYRDAPILILDEATSALDTASEIEVQKGIASLLKNRTSFIIAHRLSTIQAADRILVMERGDVVEQGTHQELLAKNGYYARYHQLQETKSRPS